LSESENIYLQEIINALTECYARCPVCYRYAVGDSCPYCGTYNLDCTCTPLTSAQIRHGDEGNE
jgi:hypothetical protein